MDINARPNRRLRCAIYTRKSSEEVTCPPRDPSV